MEIKEAVKKAFDVLKDLIPSGQLINLALEEVEFSEDKQVWNITVGFDSKKVIKKSDAQHYGLLGIAYPATTEETERKYKTIIIDDKTGKFISMKIRQI